MSSIFHVRGRGLKLRVHVPNRSAGSIAAKRNNRGTACWKQVVATGAEVGGVREQDGKLEAREEGGGVREQDGKLEAGGVIGRVRARRSGVIHSDTTAADVFHPCQPK